MKIFTSKTQKTGELGEDLAFEYLKSRGFSIVERNFNNKFGEIDIIGKKNSTYYFFEVKAGYKNGINPAENLTQEKIRKFLKSVEYYCFINKVVNFEVKGIIVILEREKTEKIEIIDLF